MLWRPNKNSLPVMYDKFEEEYKWYNNVYLEKARVKKCVKVYAQYFGWLKNIMCHALEMGS